MNINIDLKDYKIQIYGEENKENCSYYIKKINNQNIKSCKIEEKRLFTDITEKILKKQKVEKKFFKFDLVNFNFLSQIK